MTDLNGRDLGPAQFRILFRTADCPVDVAYYGTPWGCFEFYFLGGAFHAGQCTLDERFAILDLCREDYRQRQIAWRWEKAALRCRRQAQGGVGLWRGDAA